MHAWWDVPRDLGANCSADVFSVRTGFRGIIRKSTAGVQLARKGYHLPPTLYFEDAPAVVQFNRFIRSGYRANYTYCQCCKSVLALHNESGNIWSHMLPLACWLFVLACSWLPPLEAGRGELLCSAGSISVCLVGSVLYHTFLGHHSHCRKWLTVDVCGVYTVLMGSQWVCILHGFPCNPFLGGFSVALYYVVGAFCLMHSVSATSSKSRGLPMVPLLCLRVVCLISRMILGDSSKRAISMYFLAELLSFLGGAVNVLRVPERWYQTTRTRSRGPFDYFGNSHQMMHVLVALAMVFMYTGLLNDLRFFKSPEATCLV